MFVAWDLSIKRWLLISISEKERIESQGQISLATRLSHMRSYVINKILCLQYHLRKVIGKKMARWVCILIEKTFTTLFGREVYHDVA